MPKRILILVSSPEGTTALNLPRELRQLQEAVQRSQQRDYFEVELKFAATQTDLRRHILDIRPQIVHFCGHGTEQGLVLEDDNGRKQVASNEFLASLLKNFADRIECVVLNACDTEPLADALAADLNCVIGMSQPVRDEAAIVFAEAFYDRLGTGETYEQAFELGRTAVLGLAASGGDESRKATVVNQDGRPIEPANQEHRIPVLKLNPNPKLIQQFWLTPEAERQAVQELLTAIDGGFNTIQLFHTREPIVLQDQYIPVQVTLERRYRHTVETMGAYAESEAELKQLYAMKGLDEAEIKRQQVDWQEARQQESRIVVLADPGMGKSTLLRREVGATVQQAMQQIERGGALNEILNEITVPILIRLSTLAERVEQMPVLEAILAVMQERHADLLRHREPEFMAFLNGFLKQQLLNGKGLLLLDALDEVPDHQRPKLLEKLNEAGICKTCPIVATSRIVGYGGRLVDGAKDMEIVPFTQPQTEQYINQWFANAQKSLTDQTVTARGLIQALRERPQIAGLAQNPLLLSLICSLYQHNQLTFPARRSQIYERSVVYMLSRWSHDNFRQSASEAQVETKTELLAELAYQFSCKEAQVFSLRELRQRVKDYLRRENATDLDAKANRLIDELSNQDGILQKLNRDQNQYIFLHRTFQEYFAALYLKHKIEDDLTEGINCAKQHFWNYDWHETLTLLAGLLERPMPLIEAILAQKDDIFQTQFLLAGRCVAEGRELSHPLVDKMIERIYQFWLAYRSAEFIQAVVVVLGQTQEKLIQALQATLEHKGPYVRPSAAEALGKIGSRKAVDALIRALSNQDWDVRSRAAYALGKIGSEKAVDALLLALSDQDLLVRSSAAYALGKIGSEKAVDALLLVLSDQNSNVRYRAAEALGQIGSEKAVDALLQVLSDQNSNVRGRAAEELGNKGSAANLAKLLQLPKLNLEDTEVFSLARSWAIRLSKSGSPLIPVYPEVIAAQNSDEELDGTNE